MTFAKRASLVLLPVIAAAGLVVALKLDHQLVPGVRQYIAYYRVTYFMLLALAALLLAGRPGSLVLRSLRWLVVGYVCGILAYVAMSCAYPHGFSGLLHELREPYGFVLPLLMPGLALSWFIGLGVGISADRVLHSGAAKATQCEGQGLPHDTSREVPRPKGPDRDFFARRPRR